MLSALYQTSTYRKIKNRQMENIFEVIILLPTLQLAQRLTLEIL
jgi:hypothetical protein